MLRTGSISLGVCRSRAVCADLVDQLREGEGVTLTPAVSVLPSITVLGMAALLPGASADFSVVEHKGKPAARVGDRIMSALSDRQKYLKSRYPEARDQDLGTLLQRSARRLERELEGNRLLIVRSLSIDKLGETDGGLLARQIMDTVIGNIARAVRKLARLGYTYFVITADHGHQFSVRKAEDMLIDKPGGNRAALGRRWWVGRGGATAANCVRARADELGYDTDLEFIFPRGLAVFRSGARFLASSMSRRSFTFLGFSTVSLTSRLVSGAMAVSRSWSGFISPSPL